MLKQLLISSVLLASTAPQALAGPSGFWGTSQVPNVACNIWGCPNPPLGAECTINGCPPSPPVPQAPSPTVILVPSNSNGSSSNSSIGDCMDRLMYQNIQATSGPDSSGNYEFSKPQGVTDDNMTSAGLRRTYYGWKGNQPIAKVQIMDGRTAAASCR